MPGPTYEVRCLGDKAPPGSYVPRGAQRQLIEGEHRWNRELVICGGRDTGKSLACCVKSHLILSKYAGAQGVIIRRELKSMPASVLLTYERLLKAEIQHGIISKYGGERVEHYQYSNGSRLWVCGMDNADKVLSSEKDFCYVCQAEELREDDWEKLTTCTTGRSAVYPHAQTFADCNPGPAKHWLKVRCDAGRTPMLDSRHTDNPQLYKSLTEEEFQKKYGSGYHRPKSIQEAPDLVDDEVEKLSVVRRNEMVFVLSAEGWRRMRPLAALSGVRRKRLLENIWATAEGAVFPTFDRQVHVRSREKSEFCRWHLCCDSGWTDPAVTLLVGEDTDRRWHVFREFYRSHVHLAEHVGLTRAWALEFMASTAAVDNSAALLIADLRHALPSYTSLIGAKGKVRPESGGIPYLQNRLMIQGDGLPRFTIDPSCENTINEFESYEWKAGEDEPKDEYNHSVDSLRMLYEALDGGSGGATAEDWCGIVAGELTGRDTQIQIGVPTQLQREPTEISKRAIGCLWHGHPLNCTRRDYVNEIRRAVKAQAEIWDKEGSINMAQFTLLEIRRLDAMFAAAGPMLPDEELSWAGSYH
jgi:phage terminase large subunit